MIPEIPELPDIRIAQVNAMNTHKHVALPGMPHLRWESILGYNPYDCLLYTSPSPRDQRGSRMPSSA